MRCPDCGNTCVTIHEPSLLVEEPNWWPNGDPYDPPVQTATRNACLRCGWCREQIGDA